jgi:hypothetical protein
MRADRIAREPVRFALHFYEQTAARITETVARLQTQYPKIIGWSQHRGEKGGTRSDRPSMIVVLEFHDAPSRDAFRQDDAVKTLYLQAAWGARTLERDALVEYPAVETNRGDIPDEFFGAVEI